MYQSRSASGGGSNVATVVAVALLVAVAILVAAAQVEVLVVQNIHVLLIITGGGLISKADDAEVELTTG